MHSSFSEYFITSDHTSGAVTIACLGDSVTAGFFAFRTPMQAELAYPHLLWQGLRRVFPDKTVNLLSAGIGGDTAAMGLARIDRDVLSHRPDLCTVCFGANDIWAENTAEFESSLRRIVACLLQAGIRPVLMTQHHMNKTVSPDTHPDLLDIARRMAERQNSGHAASFFAVTRRLAAEYDLPLVDVWAAYDRMTAEGVDTDALLANHVNHPTPAVHRDLYAKMLLDVLTK